MEVASLALSCVKHLGILDAYSFLRRRLIKSQVAILMYHRVCTKDNLGYLEPLSPENFKRQIEYLSRNFRILSLDKFIEYTQSGKSFPEKAVIITFDDGYKDNYVYVYPTLQKYHIPATIFLTTGYVDTDKLFWWDKVGYVIQHTALKQLELNVLGRYPLHSESDKSRARFLIIQRLRKLPEDGKNSLIQKLIDISHVEIPRDFGKKLILSWKEVKEMDDGNITFGAHSVNHPNLTEIPLEQTKNEILQSKKIIEEKLGKEVVAFSYPDGHFNAEIVKLVRESGFDCALSVFPNRLISFKDNPYHLNRIIACEDFNKFRAMLCGLWGDLQMFHARLNKNV